VIQLKLMQGQSEEQMTLLSLLGCAVALWELDADPQVWCEQGWICAVWHEWNSCLSV